MMCQNRSTLVFSRYYKTQKTTFTKHLSVFGGHAKLYTSSNWPTARSASLGKKSTRSLMDVADGSLILLDGEVRPFKESTFQGPLNMFMPENGIVFD